MATEWADDPGKQSIDVLIRCIKCGWTGSTMQITQYGATSLCRESCPQCNQDVEIDDDTDACDRSDA